MQLGPFPIGCIFFRFSSGRHSSHRLGLGMAVAEGRRAERSGQRGTDVSRFGAGGWERFDESLGCQESFVHGIDGRGEAAAEAGGWNRQAHLHGAGRKCTVCGELATWQSGL